MHDHAPVVVVVVVVAGIIVLPGNYLAWLPEDDPDVAKLEDPEQIHTEPEVVRDD